MTEDEFKKQLLEELAVKKTKPEIQELIKKAAKTLDGASYNSAKKRAFFEDIISEAQDNTATMANAGEAQEIVNQLIGK